MHWYIIVKFLHVIAAIISVGGLIARQLLRQRAKRADDVKAFAALCQAAIMLDKFMVIPGMMAIIVLGVVLALIGGLPIFGFLQGAAQSWLLAANCLLIGILVLIPTVLVPRAKKLEGLLAPALAQGRITAELLAALNDSALAHAHRYEEVALVLIVALMVLKPF